MRHVVFVINNRKRLAPITLSRKQPVAKFVSNCRLTALIFFKPRVNLHDCFAHRTFAVERKIFVRRVDKSAFADKRRWPKRAIGGWRNVIARKPLIWRHLNRNNWQVVGASELKVALVARWHSHDRASAVAHQNIIGDPNRNLLASNWVGRSCASVDASFFAVVILAFIVVELAR